MVPWSDKWAELLDKKLVTRGWETREVICIDRHNKPCKMFGPEAPGKDAFPVTIIKAPVLEEKKEPPRLWMPYTSKEVDSLKAKRAKKKAKQEREAGAMRGRRGAVAKSTGADGADAGMERVITPEAKAKAKAKEKPRKTKPWDEPWDTEHNVMVSRMNHEVQVGVREYFDKPIRKESEGVQKLRVEYTMNDRQCCWNDEPDKLGEGRRTIFNNIGPYNRGGCKQQQKPSFWRKIKDWHAYSTPELHNISLTGSRVEHMNLLEALADTPAHESTAFWKGWQESQTNSKPERTNKRWDNRWNVTFSLGNQELNARCREYFSVPQGFTGLPTPGPRTFQPVAGSGAAPLGRLKSSASSPQLGRDRKSVV